VKQGKVGAGIAFPRLVEMDGNTSRLGLLQRELHVLHGFNEVVIHEELELVADLQQIGIDKINVSTERATQEPAKAGRQDSTSSRVREAFCGNDSVLSGSLGAMYAILRLGVGPTTDAF
jgi:hypothetical protein